MSDKRDEILGKLVHNHKIIMQAAWIEWRHGKGAESAMQMIENHLECAGGFVPDEDCVEEIPEHLKKDSEAYFNHFTVDY